jgi:choline dehydrogenase-like flavoprotein
MNHHWDWIVVGSGFGGSISALRLAEKGYSVLVLEKGGRFQAQDFPKSNWNLKRWFWAPALGFRGIFKMTFLRHLTSLNGVGVGGGSLVYANTLPTPGADFFQAPDWGQLADWEEELSPHYETALRMLGATENPQLTPADEALEAIATDVGRADHFHPTRVGVFFGEADKTVPDPYFGGAGPPSNRVQRMWRMHDRMPLRGQEHAGSELPLVGGEGGSDDPPQHRGRVDPAPRGRIRRLQAIGKGGHHTLWTPNPYLHHRPGGSGCRCPGNH